MKTTFFINNKIVYKKLFTQYLVNSLLKKFNSYSKQNNIVLNMYYLFDKIYILSSINFMKRNLERR